MNGSICLPIDQIEGHFKFLSSVKVKWNDSEVFQCVWGSNQTNPSQEESFAAYLSNSHICELAVVSITIFKILHFPPQTLYTVFYILMTVTWTVLMMHFVLLMMHFL